jgi:hypothetical protein
MNICMNKRTLIVVGLNKAIGFFDIVLTQLPWFVSHELEITIL